LEGIPANFALLRYNGLQVVNQSYVLVQLVSSNAMTSASGGLSMVASRNNWINSVVHGSKQNPKNCSLCFRVAELAEPTSGGNFSQFENSQDTFFYSTAG